MGLPFSKAHPTKSRPGLAILCSITNQIKGYPFEVFIPAGLPVAGAILADQVQGLDWRARKAELIRTLPTPPGTKMSPKRNPL